MLQQWFVWWKDWVFSGAALHRQVQLVEALWRQGRNWAILTIATSYLKKKADRKKLAFNSYLSCCLHHQFSLLSRDTTTEVPSACADSGSPGCLVYHLPMHSVVPATDPYFTPGYSSDVWSGEQNRSPQQETRHLIHPKVYAMQNILWQHHQLKIVQTAGQIHLNSIPGSII